MIKIESYAAGEIQSVEYCTKIGLAYRLHRTDGPAYEESTGYKAWYIAGVRHRIDGPAVIYPDGSGSYYIDGLWNKDIIAP